MSSPTSTPASYSRETAIQALTSFYSFLASNIPGLSPEDVKSTPKDGWPALLANPTLLAPVNKTDSVLDLILHLPNLQPSCDLTQIAPETSLINYSSASMEWSLERNLIQGTLEPHCTGKIPPHVAILPEGSRYGSWLLLDTKRGPVTDYIRFERPERDTPGPEEAHYWRAYRTLPVGEFFKEWKDKFRSLEWVFLPDDGDDGVRYRFDEETGEIRQIYKDHGWLDGSDNFGKEECRVALKSGMKRIGGRCEVYPQRHRLA